MQNCASLKLLDIRVQLDYLTLEDAKEITSLYCRYGESPRLMVRSNSRIWLDEQMTGILSEIKSGNRGRRAGFVIDCRSISDGFWNKDDEGDESAVIWYDHNVD